MKITSNRKDDILKRKAEYEEDYNRRLKQVEDEQRAYQDAENAVTDPVRQTLLDLLAKYPRLSSNVSVERSFFGSDGLRVQIKVDDLDVHNKSKSLSWNYDAYIKDGEVVRETGSWSGLNAVTPEQLEHLEQSVACLKELSTLDWDDILRRAVPAYQDYLHTRNPEYDPNKPDFDAELAEAEIDEIIGQRKMIEVEPFTSSWYYDSRLNRKYQKNVFVAVVRDSGSQYTIIECPVREYNEGEAGKYFDRGNTHRVKKDQIKPITPINIVEV